jgi:hypothetical protein
MVTEETSLLLLAHWNIPSDRERVVKHSFTRQISKEMSKHWQIVSK